MTYENKLTERAVYIRSCVIKEITDMLVSALCLGNEWPKYVCDACTDIKAKCYSAELVHKELDSLGDTEDEEA